MADLGDLIAGKVKIPVEPDTRGFRDRLLNQLRELDSMDATVPVSFDPDETRLREAMDRINGNNLRAHVEFDPDTASLDEAQQRVQHALGDKRVRFTADSEGFNRDVQRMLQQSDQLHSKAQRPINMRVSDEGFRKAIQDSRDLSNRQEELSHRVQRLSEHMRVYQSRLNSAQLTSKRLAAAGEDGTRRFTRLQHTIASLSTKVESTGRALNQAERHMHSVARQAENTSERVRKMGTAFATASHDIGKLQAPGLDSFSRQVEQAVKRQSQAMREQTRSMGAYVRGTESDLDALKRSVNSATGAIDRDWLRMAEGMRRSMAQSRENADLLRERIQALQGTMEHLQSTHPLGVGNNEAFRRARTEVERLKNALDTLARGGRVDMHELEASFISASNKLEEFQRHVNRLDNKNINIEFTERNYDRVVSEIDRLERHRIDVPVDLQLSLEQIRRRWAELRRKAGEGKDIKLDLDLDLKTRQAREEIKRFERRNNELKMDVDLETALARAHLAAFTRPRTIDIFARFHGTDLGKILNGATYGATGLGALNDQFDKLVGLFDKIDKRAPMYTALANVFTSIGAGAVSLTQATFGLGAGLVSLSKAAFAAPSALLGVGSAFLSLKLMIGANSKALNGYFADIGHNIESGFKQTGNTGLRELNKTLLPRIERGLRQVAAAEGTVFNNLVSATNRAIVGPARQLPTIFNDTSTAIRRLSPGLTSMWTTLLQLGSDTSKYLPRMAGWVDNLAIKWSNWLSVAERSGKIDAALQEAINQGHLFVQSMGDVITFAEGMWRALNPKSHGLEGFEGTLASMSRAVNSARFQDVMGAWSKASQDAAHQIRGSFSEISDAAVRMKNPIANLIKQSGSIVSSAIGNGSQLIASVAPGLNNLVHGTSQGLQEIINAITHASPAFNSLLTMIGDMSKTFGGTFASALKAATPLIQAIANAADDAAKAFDSLPEPIKATIGLYATFGRAGVKAVSSLKQGILENINSTLQYRQTLMQLGVQADQLGTMSFPNLARAWHAAHFGDDVQGINALASGLGSMGAAAESGASSSVRLGGALQTTGKTTSRLSGFVRGAKTVFSDLFDVMGGWTGVGITAALTAVSSAVSNVQEHAEKAADAIKKMGDAAQNISTPKTTTDRVLNNQLSNLEKNPDIVNRGFGDGNNFMNWLVSASTSNDFQTAKQSMDQLGISQKELTGYLEEGSQGVKNLRARIQEVVQANHDWIDQRTGIRHTTSDYVDAGNTLNASIDNIVKSYKNFRSKVSDFIGSNKFLSKSQQQVNAQFEQFSTVLKANGGGMKNQQNVDYVKDLAQQAIILANGIQSNVSAFGSQEKASQQARVAIEQYRESLVSQLVQSGMSEQDANKMADSLGLVAKNWQGLHKVTLQTADAYMRMANVSSDVKDRIDTAIDNGTIKTWSEFQSIVKDLEKNPDHKIVFTADGKAVTLTAQQCKALGVEWKNNRFESKFDAKDLTSGKMLGIVNNWKNTKKSMDNLKAILDADPTKANYDIDSVRQNAEALGLTPAEIRIITSGANLTKSQLDEIKNKLKDKGLNDKQINVALQTLGFDTAGATIDGAKGKIQDLKDEADKLSHDPITFSIIADVEMPGKRKYLADDLHGYVQNLADMGFSGGQIRKIFTVVFPKKDQKILQDALNKTLQSINGIPPEKDTNIKARDNASKPAKNAKKNIGSVPKNHNTNISANGNASKNAKDAKKNIDNVPKSHHTDINAGGNASSRAKAAAGDIIRIPGNHHTNLSAGGNAASNIQKVMDAANRLPKQKTIRITTVWEAIRHGDWGKAWNLAWQGKFASGGRIHGPGSETSDSIPAMLSNNEMVLNAASVHRIDRLYPGLLDRMNAVGDVPNIIPEQPLRLAAGTVRLSDAALNVNASTSDGVLTQLLESSLKKLAYESGEGRVKYVQNVTNNLHTTGSQNVQAALLASRMRGQTQDLLNVGGGF